MGAQEALVRWLKTSLQLFYPQIIRSCSKQDLHTLASIQAYIQKKTKHIEKQLVLKGKLDMLLIHAKLAPSGDAQTTKPQTLVFKDHDMQMSDEDEELDEEQDEEEEDDEEIKEIDIRVKKRQRKDQESYGEEDEPMDDEVADSGLD